MTAPDPTTSDATLDLLDRWRAGDTAARDQLLIAVMPWLQRQVSHAMGSAPRGADESMDLVQTAVLNFLRWGPKFVPVNGAQFCALLKRIAVNEVIGLRRRAARGGGGRHLDSLLGADGQSADLVGPSLVSYQPSRAAARSEDREWVRLALQFLPDDDRYLLLAAEVEGHDWATIAKELGLASPDTARMRCTRLKPKVANLLRQLKAGKAPEGD